jgi:hypothetical protein
MKASALAMGARLGVVLLKFPVSKDRQAML